MKTILVISVTTFLILLFLFSSGSSSNSRTYETIPQEIIKIYPATEIIFDVTKPNKLDIKFEILKGNSYTFSWMFHCYQEPRKKESSLVRNLKFLLSKPKYPTLKEMEDSRRVLDLIEAIEKSERKSPKKGQRSIIIPMQFKIFAVENSEEKLVWDSEMERVINEKMGSTQNRGNGSGYFMVHFANPSLEPGVYHMILETKKGVSEFMGTKVGIRINGDNHK